MGVKDEEFDSSVLLLDTNQISLHANESPSHVPFELGLPSNTELYSYANGLIRKNGDTLINPSLPTLVTIQLEPNLI